MPKTRIVRNTLFAFVATLVTAGFGLSRLSMRAGDTPKVTIQPPSANPGADAPATGFPEFRKLAGKYCKKCHAGGEKEGGFTFDDYADLDAIGRGRKTWGRLATYVQTKQMPPEDESAQPTDAERSQMVDWVKAELARQLHGKKDPGRVTVRRLNRSEYNNTIRDVFGVDIRPADAFPGDDTGYGFDTIGDALTVSSLLMEHYLKAAERVAETVIIDVSAKKPQKERLMADKLREGTPPANKNGVFVTDGSMTARFTTIKDAGNFKIRVHAYADQAGKEPAQMGIKPQGYRKDQLFAVKAVEGKSQTYEYSTGLRGGAKNIVISFLNDFYDEKAPGNNRDRNLHVEWVEIVGPVDATYEGLPDAHRRILPKEPNLKNPATTAREALAPLARRLYRRPPTNKELTKLVACVTDTIKDGDSFEVGIRFAIQTMLCSPQFLYRFEFDAEPQNPLATRRLTDYELATRLSYFLWSSTPDDALLDLAASGTLSNPQTLENEVRRMLVDPKSEGLVDDFAGQWLELRKLNDISPDVKKFPTFDESLRQAMKQESERFFDYVVKQDRSVLDFLDADYTFVNEQLATHYGIPSVFGKQFRKVDLKDRNRGGIVTQASILLMTSNPTRTSPVKRGKWILEQMFADPPPPPPPGAGDLPDDNGGPLTGTLRQRMEQHRNKPGCAVCHVRLDPLGFGLENFDAVGGFRSKDGKDPIDSSGVLPTGESFAGPAQLKEVLLKKKDEFVRCLIEKLLVYSLGRGIEDTDHAVILQMSENVAKKGYRFSAVVNEIVRSDVFLMRRGEGERP